MSTIVKDRIEQIIAWCETENKMYQDALDRGAMGMVSVKVTETLISGNNQTIKYLKSLLQLVPK